MPCMADVCHSPTASSSRCNRLFRCGFGLSLGIEGGFTQAAGAVGSKAGQLLNRRRHDVRMLVGAGAAGGIAGAFGAPFAGAAYGFELIVGSYTVATLAPVVAASVAGTLSARALIGHTYHIPLDVFDVGQDGHAVTAVVLGILCGLLSVVLMRGVTTTESFFYRSRVRTTFASRCRRNSSRRHRDFRSAHPRLRSPSYGARFARRFAAWLVGCRPSR